MKCRIYSRRKRYLTRQSPTEQSFPVCLESIVISIKKGKCGYCRLVTKIHICMTLRGTNHMPIFRVSLDLCMIAAIVLLLAAGHGCNGFVSHRASLISKRSGIMPQEAPVSSRLRSRIPSGKITANAEERDILRPATATRCILFIVIEFFMTCRRRSIEHSLHPLPQECRPATV